MIRVIASEKKFGVKQSSLLVKDLVEDLKQDQQTPMKDGSQQPKTYTLLYEILQKPVREKADKTKLLTKRSKREEDASGDLEEEELMEMLVEIFSIILLKKRKNNLKLESNDRNAVLPHPSQLLKGRRRQKILQKKLFQGGLPSGMAGTDIANEDS